MNKLSSIFKSKNIIMAIILVILIFIVLFLGSIIRITWFMRIVIIVFIFLIFIILLLFKKIKDEQKSRQIEESINNSSEQRILSPEKRLEIEQFRKQLEAAINALKNSKLGRGKSGKSALYSLPWYLIIGPSAAGKTTAIQNSGLEFPYGKDSIKGVGGTRNCDWFFSTRAIFLDTAGRYITETEDRPEWIAFLETLKKNRTKKPINGVIVAINIDEIIKCDDNRLGEHAKNIRRRIDELIENLGIVFPVYFVFTKCDLIQGFVEYFEDFSETERSQIWGSTSDTFLERETNPKNIFGNEFDKLADVIYNSRIIRLSNPLKREQRRKVFLFPFQFRSLKQKLIYLIGEVFQQNPYQDNPIFRGFYFTSGTQEGSPLDLAIKEIAKQFNLIPASGEVNQEIIETKNYFIKDMLNDVVIADQDLVLKQTSMVVQKNRITRLLTISASSIFFVILSILIILSYYNSYDNLESISLETKSFSASNLNWNSEALSSLIIADRIRDLAVRAKTKQWNQSFIAFGLDESDQTVEEVTRLYLKKTRPFFDRYVYKEIENTLSNYCFGQEYSSEQIYNYLKAYLLLDKERSKLDHSNKEFLREIFNDILNSIFSSASLKYSIIESDSLKKLFNNFSSFFIDQLHDKSIIQILTDEYLIHNVRRRYENKPDAESIYSRIKSNGISQFSEITFDEFTGNKSQLMLNTELRIPYIYTENGCKDYIYPKILDVIKNPNEDEWIVGKNIMNATSQTQYDSLKILANLTDFYTEDLIKFWTQYLESLRYDESDFESVSSSANSLKLLSEQSASPLVLTLNSFAHLLKTVSEIQVDTNTAIKYQTDLSIKNHFDIRRFRQFIVGSDDGTVKPELNNIISEFTKLFISLEDIKDVQDSNNELIKNQNLEFQSVKRIIKSSTTNVPEFISLLTIPVNMSIKSVNFKSVSYINKKWKEKVFDVFNSSLKNTFPFSDGGMDAPIQDFEDFFNPQGILWSFFNSELSSLIDKENWKPYKSDDEGISISKELLRSLKQADDIKKVFFKNANSNITFKLKPQVPLSKPINGKDPYVEQVSLNINGIEDYYRNGSQFWKEYSWQGRGSKQIATLSISIKDISPPGPKFYEGVWSLFRLLGEANISSSGTQSQLILKWKFFKPNLFDVEVIYLVDTQSSKHPFSKNFFKSFQLPEKIN